METTFLVSLAWVAGHLGLFLIWFRHNGASQSGGGILLFHAGSVLALGALELVLWLTDPREAAFAGAVAGGALHGIYSLSLLELWALSKTGFSLRVLADIEAKGSRPVVQIVDEHVKLSGRKKSDRLSLTGSLGLITRTGGSYSLTPRGRWIAGIVHVLNVMAGNKEVG